MNRVRDNGCPPALFASVVNMRLRYEFRSRALNEIRSRGIKRSATLLLHLVRRSRVEEPEQERPGKLPPERHVTSRSIVRQSKILLNVRVRTLDRIQHDLLALQERLGLLCSLRECNHTRIGNSGIVNCVVITVSPSCTRNNADNIIPTMGLLVAKHMLVLAREWHRNIQNDIRLIQLGLPVPCKELGHVHLYLLSSLRVDHNEHHICRQQAVRHISHRTSMHKVSNSARRVLNVR